MGSFFSGLISEFLKSLQGEFSWGHMFTVAVGLIFLIVSWIRFSDDGAVQGCFTLISTLFYVYAFYATCNNFAKPTSFTVFCAIAVVLQFLMWTISEGLSLRQCFKSLWGYLLMLAPMFVMGMLQEGGVAVPEWFAYQFSFLLTAAVLSVAVPAIANGSSSSYSGSRHEDPVHWATGDEQSVDTVSMSD